MIADPEQEYFFTFADYDGTNLSLMPAVELLKPLGRLQGFGGARGVGIIDIATRTPLNVIIAYLRRSPELASKITILISAPEEWR